jgi:formate dehydrogenase subunit gamma
VAGTPRPASVLRFDRVERVAHWANALLFAILMATALPLYFGSIAGLVGRRELLAQIHVWSGVALPVPLLISLAGPWGARFRADVRRINRWTGEEVAWLRSFGARARSKPDKFNPGQKLNAAFTAGAILVMLASGSILKWFQPFPLSWRTGATFVHDVLAAAIFAVVTGHVLFALTHPQALRSMVTGRISRSWAEHHAGAWLAEEDATAPGADPVKVVTGR